MHRRASSARMVGRAAELSALTETLADASAADFGISVVSITEIP